MGLARQDRCHNLSELARTRGPVQAVQTKVKSMVYIWSPGVGAVKNSSANL